MSLPAEGDWPIVANVTRGWTRSRATVQMGSTTLGPFGAAIVLAALAGCVAGPGYQRTPHAGAPVQRMQPNQIRPPSPVQVAASERADPDEMGARHEVFDAAKREFIAGDFESLDRQAHDYLVHKSRTPSGVWKLGFFYGGIDDVMTDAEAKGFNAMDAVLRKALDWQTKYPKSPSAGIVNSMMLLDFALTIRGTGTADTVKPDDWPTIDSLVERSRMGLLGCKQTCAVDPQWYRTMSTVALLQGWNRRRFDQLINEAFEKEPVYYDTYFAAVHYLLPQWHGDLDQLDSFVRSVTERTSATEGAGMYTRIYWSASQSAFNDALFESSKASWPEMKEGFEDILKRYPSSWNANSYAKFACLAHDKTKAKELTARIRGSVITDAWPAPDSYDSCVRWSNRDPATSRQSFEPGHDPSSTTPR